MKVRDAVVVITGASSGIGRATALALAKHGAQLVLAARGEEPLRQAAGECERYGASVLAVPTDVSDENAVEELASQAVEAFGRVDVWLNNAAVSLFVRFDEAPSDAYRRVIETNLFGYIYGARAALRRFREQGAGTLINNASVVATLSQPYTSAYSISKHGIRALSESLRQELYLDGASNIHVCTLLPATIDTPLFQHAANYTGWAVRAMPPVYAPEQVAQAVVQLIERPQRELMVGGVGRMLNLMRKLAPGAAERMFARKVHKDHLDQQTPVEPSDGNLFGPMVWLNGVRGGWRSPTRSLLRRAAPLGLAALGLGALAHRRPDLVQRLGLDGFARKRPGLMSRLGLERRESRLKRMAEPFERAIGR